MFALEQGVKYAAYKWASHVCQAGTYDLSHRARKSIRQINLLVESAYPSSRSPLEGRGAFQEHFTTLLVRHLQAG